MLPKLFLYFFFIFLLYCIYNKYLFTHVFISLYLFIYIHKYKKNVHMEIAHICYLFLLFNFSFTITRITPIDTGGRTDMSTDWLPLLLQLLHAIFSATFFQFNMFTVFNVIVLISSCSSKTCRFAKVVVLFLMCSQSFLWGFQFVVYFLCKILLFGGAK